MDLRPLLQDTQRAALRGEVGCPSGVRTSVDTWNHLMFG